MKTILYFYTFQLNALCGSFLKFVKEHPFSESVEHGFILDANDSDGVRARFIFKELVTETVQNPFGEEIPITRIRYDITKIRVRSVSGILEVCNPGRKLSKCLKMISEAWSCNPIKLSPNFRNIYNSLSELDAEFAVLSLETGCFTIKSRTACSVSFQALVDVREDVKYFLGEREYGINRVKCGLSVDGQNVLVDIANTGRVVANFDSSLPLYESLVLRLIESMSS